MYATNPLRNPEALLTAVIVMLGGPVVADAQKQANEKLMPEMNRDSMTRLEQYLEADTRYSIVPIPTPLDRLTGEAFALQKIRWEQSAGAMRKLYELAAFHHLEGTAKVWQALAQRPVAGGEDEVKKAAYAIAALAWLGDQKQVADAGEAYGRLLRAASPDTDRETLSVASSALGSADSADKLKTWATDHANRIEKELARPGASDNPAARRNNELRVEMIRQFARIQVPRLEQTFRARKEVLSIEPPKARIPKLIVLYCETAPLSSSELVLWSAVELNRSVADPEARQSAQTGLLQIAREHNRKDEDMQPELDATRARALRAAVYFGTLPEDEELQWLASQADPGTDFLVMRPNWQYAAPHGSHGTNP